MGKHFEVTRRNDDAVLDGNVSAMYVQQMASGSWSSLIGVFASLYFFEQAIEHGIPSERAVEVAAKAAAAMSLRIETGATTPKAMLPHYPIMVARYENLALTTAALLCRKSTLVRRDRLDGTALYLSVISTLRRENAKRMTAFTHTGMAEPWSVTAERARRLVVRMAKGAVDVKVGTSVENAESRDLAEALELLIRLSTDKLVSEQPGEGDES